MSEEQRCDWCTAEPLYIQYHDLEWGVPLTDSVALFELLVLEGMQAGLSWWTILKKREHMRDVFFRFDPERLSQADQRDMDAWLGDPGVIRHRGKLEAMVINARAYLQITDFADFLWSAVGGKPKVNEFTSLSDVPAQTEVSAALAKRLKKAGFRFVGATTVYAFMQSAGMVNDHLLNCPQHRHCAALADRFTI